MVNKRSHVVRLKPFGLMCRYVCTCGKQSRLFTERYAAKWAGQIHANANGGQFIDERRHRYQLDR